MLQEIIDRESKGDVVVQLDARSMIPLRLLIIVAILNLLLSPLFFWLTGPLRNRAPQLLDSRPGNAIDVASSSDGRIVYLTDGEQIYRSDRFGDRGSWRVIAITDNRLGRNTWR